MADYDLKINLLDKTITTPTVVRDLKPFFAKVEATHTGVQKTNNALLTLVVPPDGKFIRIAPLLMDENTKNKFMIEIEITQGANVGQNFRCEIGQPTAKSDENLGEIIEIPLVAQEFVVKEHFDSPQDLFTTPAGRFLSLVFTYNFTSGSGGVSLLPLFPVGLPDEDVTRQNWLPLAPTKTSDLLEDIIKRLAETPSVGGVLNDFYYDFKPNSGILRVQEIFAEEFGLQSSGVEINPLTVGQVGAESGNTFNLDNLIFKNLVILKGDPNCGSLPFQHQIFTSEYLHAIQRPLWNSGTTYETGDVVKLTVSGFPEQRFYTSLMDSNLGNNPSTSPLDWLEDFSIDPGDAVFFTPTPWTEDLPNFEANLSGKDNLPIGPGGPFVGYMVDYNITRVNYDRAVPEDNTERVSVKMVDDRANSPPATSELWTGKRIIVGVAGSTDGSISGAFAPGSVNRGRIAEATVPTVGSATFKFSDAPIDTGSGSTRQQDSVNYWRDATVLVWDDSANGGNGDWIEQWNVNSNLPATFLNPSDAGKSAGSPFHPCQQLASVTGATGIPNQAILARFNWKAQSGLGILADPINGNPRNVASRGAWLSFMFPYPRDVTATGGIGNEYGKENAFPFLDTFNLTRNADGEVGWNKGEEATGLGTISSISFKLRLGQFKSNDDSELLIGVADTPMIFWAMDRADRIFVQDFTQRYNNQWEAHTIPVGPRAPQSIYNSRIDELEKPFGHILPNFDFFLPEREFNGIFFDWRFLKGFGMFMKNSYDAQGLYSTVYDQWFQTSSEAIQQAGQNLIDFLNNALNGEPQAPSTNFVTDHTKIALDELHFDKELYVLSEDGIVDNPRVFLERDETQDDYLDARAKARAIATRKTFFPQFWFITARGDVRMKLGQRFIMTGPRVPDAPLELVCSQVKHRIDTDGYFMEIFGIRKFVLP